MEDVLKNLSEVHGIGGGFLVSREGFVLSHFWKDEKELDLLAANLTDLVNIASDFAEKKVSGGTFRMLDLDIEGEKLRIFINVINENTFLAVLADKSLPLGMLRLEIKAAVQKLKSVI